MSSARPVAPPPTVSLVIPAFNEETTIERCLLAALRQTRAAREIIVVDNRSTDGTAAVVRRVVEAHPDAGIRILRQFDAQGLVPTRNAGFAAARGDILGRIDADSVIAPDWVANVSEAMGDPTIGAVTGPVTYYDVPLLGSSSLSDDLVRRPLWRLGRRRCPFLYGSNMAVRAQAWHAIEGSACADHDDVLHEDIDLAVHLKQTGIRVAYAPRMRAGVSARRVESSPSSFRAYTHRFHATYESHGIDHWTLRAPRHLLQGVYWGLRSVSSLAPSSATREPEVDLGLPREV
ncbi:glycosyltransferase family 2 protein [Nocardiopsis sp. Huas11]|uniref:glycosyltransferase n=1 Tax=Nocardiopsis sp. Huas11 TaxID=2183912 RepID=UPI0018F6A84E|nr:glycosyltransferase family 2 protein [Nocardiopsis sp. Huas11]